MRPWMLVGLLVGCGGGGGSDVQLPCDRYAHCCATLNPSLGAQCESQLAGIRAYPDQQQVQQACSSALEILRGQGYCAEPSASDPASGPLDLGVRADLSSPAGTQSCRATFDCVGNCERAVACRDPGSRECEACYVRCEERASTVALDQMHALLRCLELRCASGDEACVRFAMEVGGACARETAACLGQARPPSCTPSCAGKVCGPDGCGGNCGTCPWGSCSAAGTCVCANDAQCGAGYRCLIDPNQVRTCRPSCDVLSPAVGCAAGTSCMLTIDALDNAYGACAAPGLKTEGETCAASGECAAGHDCVIFTSYTRCARLCDYAHPCKTGQTCVGLVSGNQSSPYSACNPPKDACTPNPCTQPNKNVCSLQNGTPVCACNSGYIDVGGTCQCVPNCAGKVCGSDGCGGSCGMCESNQTCNASGQCVCAPQCSGRNCGDNGCGGVCGTCGFNQTCNASGQCVCVPNCAGRVCGSDGCGGTCGPACGSGKICDSSGQCVTCTPNCVGRTCGDNGCGGSCGTCGTGTTCSGGSCVVDNDCDPVSNTGCAAPNECVLLASEETRCVLTGTGRDGSSCSASVTCDGGYACLGGTCRKVCRLGSNAACPIGSICNGVTGWFEYGGCARSP